MTMTSFSATPFARIEFCNDGDSMVDSIVVPNNTTAALTFSDASSFFSCVPGKGGLHLSPKPSNSSQERSGDMMIESSGTMSALRQDWLQNDKTTVVMEAWITPVLGHDESSLPIVTIGIKDNVLSSYAMQQQNGCPGKDFGLAQRNGFLEVTYAEDNAARTCRVLLVNTVELKEELTQVMVVLSRGETSVYMNGQKALPTLPNAIEGNLATWNPNYTAQFFGNNLNKDDDAASAAFPLFFDGSIHQFSIYDTVMDDIPRHYASEKQRLLEFALPRNLQVLPSLPSISIAQDAVDERLSFVLGGYNASLLPYWSIMVEIVSFPQHGVLSLSNTPDSLVLSRGDVLATSSVMKSLDDSVANNNMSNVLVDYRLKGTDYFNTPQVTAKGQVLNFPLEFLEYRIVAVDPVSGNRLAVSESATQRIDVVHVNHKPSFARTTFLEEDPIVPVVSRIENEMPYAYIDNRIQLEDSADYNLDMLRVDLWASNGTLTLNEDFRSLAMFSECSDRSYSGWQCMGDGIQDRSMTFICPSDDVNKILSHLRYESFGVETDEVVVRVLDGQGDECLSAQEHAVVASSQESIRRECFSISMTIPVARPILSLDGSGSSRRGGSLISYVMDPQNYDLPDLIFFGMTLLSLGFLCTVLECLRRCLARGTKVFPETHMEDDEDEDVSIEMPTTIVMDSV